MRQVLSNKAPCQGHHVQAHSGAPWNELADAVAKALAKEILQPSSLPTGLIALLHHKFLDHAWTEVAIQSSKDLRSCCEWPSVFRLEGPNNPLVADTFWLPPTEIEAPPAALKPLQVNLRIGAANVLTLDCGAQVFQKQGKLLLGRVGFLQKQFADLGLHIIGLQETRSQGQVTRHNQHWWVFQSGCTEAGTHGIELWFTRRVPYGQDGSKPLLFLQHHFTVLAFHSRYLLLEVNAPAFQVHVLCVHSPFMTSAAMSPDQFWDQIESTIARVSDSHWPLIVLGGFNAKLGSVQSEAVSNHDAEPESTAGELMHRFMLGRSLCAPSTFRSCHVSSSPTWQVDSKAASRIDYVLVPLEWLSPVTSSQVHLDVDLLTEHDHQLVSLSLSLRLRDTTPRLLKQPRPSQRSLRDAEKVHAFLADVEALESLPWTLGVGHHCEQLTQQLQSLCRRRFVDRSRPPIQQHFSETTWNLVTIRHTLLRTIHRLDSLLKRSCGLLHLRAWYRLYVYTAGNFTSAMSSGSDMTLPSLDFSVVAAMRSQALLLKMDLIALRQQMKIPARQASRQDRLRELKSIAVRFVNSASLSNARQVHKCLKPLLGSFGRKAVLAAKPLPAIHTDQRELAQSRAELASTWRQHFASIEGGVHAFSQSMFQNSPMPPLDLWALPTLTQVEAVIRRSKSNKAPGPDNLPAAIFKLSPVLFARLLYPLYLKIGLRCHEPLKFRGGEIMALAKKATSRFQCKDYRAIVLADQMGKYHHAIQRQKLLPALASFKTHMQAGCAPGTGVDHVHLQLEAYTNWAAGKKRSFCVLFLDVASAYYKAVRAFIVDDTCSDHSIIRMFQHNGWQPELFHEFMATLKEPSAFAQAGVSPHLHCQMRSCLQSTWFALRQMPGTLTQTSQGTRPGNPLADLLFAFLFSRVTRELHQQLDSAGLIERFPLQWLPAIPLDVEEQELFSPCLGSWADDLYLATSVSKASDLISTAQTITAIALDVAASHGLALNLGEDKTNLLLVPRGSGSFDFKRQVASASCPRVSVTTRSLGEVSVQIVRDYVHLGTLFDGNSCHAEIHRRYLLTAPLVKHLRRRVFGEPSLALNLRATLFQSYVLSRFLFGSSTWHFLTKKEYQLFFTLVLKLYGALLPRGLRGPGFQSLDLLACTRQLHPALLLAKHRLALLGRMCDHELVSLWSVLQASSTWCQQVFQDLQTVAFWVPEFPGWQLDDSLSAALEGVLGTDRGIPTLVRLAESRFFRYLDLWRDLQSFRDEFFSLVQAGGAVLE